MSVMSRLPVLAGALSLAVSAGGAPAQTAQDPSREEVRTWMDVVLKATLPDGWRMSRDAGGIAFQVDDPALQAMFVQSPSSLLGFSLFSDGPIHRVDGTLLGAPVRFYRADGLIFAAGGLQASGGSTIFALFQHCIEPVTDDHIGLMRMMRAGDLAPVVMGFHSAEGFAGFDIGGAFDVVLDGLELSLPWHLQPCPPRIDAPLRAVPAPVVEDGWASHEHDGLAVSLPVFLQAEGLEDGVSQYAGTERRHGGQWSAMVVTDPDAIAGLFEQVAGFAPAADTMREIDALGMFRDLHYDLRAEPGFELVARALVAEGPLAPLGVVIVTEAAGSETVDWPAVTALQGQIAHRLAASGAHPPGFVVLGQGGRLILRERDE